MYSSKLKLKLYKENKYLSIYKMDMEMDELQPSPAFRKRLEELNKLYTNALKDIQYYSDEYLPTVDEWYEDRVKLANMWINHKDDLEKPILKKLRTTYAQVRCNAQQTPYYKYMEHMYLETTDY